MIIGQNGQSVLLIVVVVRRQGNLFNLKIHPYVKALKLVQKGDNVILNHVRLIVKLKFIKQIQLAVYYKLIKKRKIQKYYLIKKNQILKIILLKIFLNIYRLIKKEFLFQNLNRGVFLLNSLLHLMKKGKIQIFLILAINLIMTFIYQMLEYSQKN